MAVQVDRKAAGKVLAEKIAAKLPEAQRAGFLAIVAEEAALAELGDSALRQEDYSRLAAEAQGEGERAKQWKKQLDEWHEGKREDLNKLTKALEENEELKRKVAAGGSGGEGGDPTPAPAAPAFDEKAFNEKVMGQVNQTIAAATGSVVPLLALMTTLAGKHSLEFGEPLDGGALIEHCTKTNLPIDKGGYEDFVREKRAEKEVARVDKLVKDAEERGRLAGLQAGGGTTPYPVGGQEPSTVSALFATDEQKGQFGVKAAVESYRRGMAARGTS